MNALVFLLIVLVICAIGGFVLWLQHRQPTSMESGVDAFKREMDALAPPLDDPEPKVQRPKRPRRPGPRSGIEGDS